MLPVRFSRPPSHSEQSLAPAAAVDEGRPLVRALGPEVGAQKGVEDEANVALLCTVLALAASARRASDAPDVLAASEAAISAAAALAFSAKVLTPFLDGLAAVGRAQPEALARSGETYRRQVLAMNAAVLGELAALAERLEADGVFFLVVKGPLQQQLLHGTFFARPSSDVDVLVPPFLFGRAMASLAALGFHPAAGASPFWWDRFLGERHLLRPGLRPMTVDLHHRLQQPGTPSPRRPEAFFAEREAVHFRDRAIPVLGRGHVALLSAMSLVKAFFNREPAAGHACDLFVAVREPPGEAAFLAAARAQGLDGTARLALRCLEAVFGRSFATIDDERGRAAILPELSVHELQAMVVAPARVPAFPSRRRVLRTACGGDHLLYVSELARMVLSDLTRRALERPSAKEAG